MNRFLSFCLILCAGIVVLCNVPTTRPVFAVVRLSVTKKLPAQPAATQKFESQTPATQLSAPTQVATNPTTTGPALTKPAPTKPATTEFAAISFQKQVAPILLEQCVDCHNTKKSKGGYNLETFERLLQPGDSNHAAIKPGEANESELYRLLVTIEDEDRMPKKAPPLSKADTEIIRQWIEQGARFDAGDKAALLTSYSHSADHPNAPNVYARPIPITAIAYSPDGTQLAIGGYHEAILWDNKLAKISKRIGPLPQNICDLCFTPDGNSLAIAGGNPGRTGEAWLADVKTGERGKLIKRSRDVVTALAISRDGKRLAIGGADNAIDLYAMRDLQKPLHITQHTDWITQLAFNSDGTRLASASRDKSARIIDCKTGDSISSCAAHSEGVLGVAWSADNSAIFSTGHDKILFAWKPDDAKEIGKISGFELDPLRPVTMGDHIFVPCADGIVREYTMSDRNYLHAYPRNNSWIYSIAIDAGSHQFSVGTGNGEIVRYSTHDGKEIARFSPLPK